MSRRRLDQILIDRGLAESREQARALVLTGRIRGAAGRRYTKPGQAVADGIALRVAPAAAFVSRGGPKLLAALERWQVGVAGAVCLDVGASTGGFTDCLLQRGAERVFAVDVGYGQIAETLRRDARVVVMERVNARALPPLRPRPRVVTVDVSFISVRKVLPAVAAVAAPRADVLTLIKPQFEASREAVGRGGVVRSASARAGAVASVAAWAIQHGWRAGGVLESPVPGPAGNWEYFVWLRTPPLVGERVG